MKFNFINTRNCFFCKTLIAIIVSLTTQLFADESIRFVPEPYPIGTADQGDIRHIIIKGANVTNKEISLENILGQGVGMSNFKYPKKIAPNSSITIEFDMDFSGMEGQINPVVVMIGTDGTPYTATLDGIVKAPIFFNEKLFDAGFYKAGEKREWTFYVWETDKKQTPDITLDDNAKKEFSIKTKPVKLNVEKLDQIKEGGNVPALKVTLSTKGLTRNGLELKQKSISKIVSFKSKRHPKATPEILIVGYWKE